MFFDSLSFDFFLCIVLGMGIGYFLACIVVAFEDYNDIRKKR